MQKSHTYTIIRGLVAALFLVVLVGCDKFVKHESEHLAPFAQQTIDLIGTLEYSLSENRILYLYDIHEYTDVDDPYNRYLALENQVGNMLAAVVTYSLQIVVISEQDTSENQKANQLADVIVALIEMVQQDQVLANENIDADMIDDAVARVRQSDDYLEALRLLMPLVNEFTAHAGRVLDELGNEKRQLVFLLEQAIDKKYGAAIDLHREIRLVKDDMYRSLVNLSQYSVTRDPKYFEKMKSYGSFSVTVATENKKSLTSDQIAQLHQAITSELSLVSENYRQLLPDVEDYYDHRRELARVVEFKDDAIREARQTFVVWSRAYQKMASGKVDPAEWFDLSETGKLLFGAARKAVEI
jgi:flagellar biosynthesis chaperone FliJ